MTIYTAIKTANDTFIDITIDQPTNEIIFYIGAVPIKFKLDELVNRICPPYQINPPEEGFKKMEDFSKEEKQKYRQIAETLAMLDGNAFFGNFCGNNKNEWYEQYLGEAKALYDANGGDDGWAGESSINNKD